MDSLVLKVAAVPGDLLFAVVTVSDQIQFSPLWAVRLAVDLCAECCPANPSGYSAWNMDLANMLELCSPQKYLVSIIRLNLYF